MAHRFITYDTTYPGHDLGMWFTRGVVGADRVFLIVHVSRIHSLQLRCVDGDDEHVVGTEGSCHNSSVAVLVLRTGSIASKQNDSS